MSTVERLSPVLYRVTETDLDGASFCHVRGWTAAAVGHMVGRMIRKADEQITRGRERPDSFGLVTGSSSHVRHRSRTSSCPSPKVPSSEGARLIEDTPGQQWTVRVHPNRWYTLTVQDPEEIRARQRQEREQNAASISAGFMPPWSRS